MEDIIILLIIIIYLYITYMYMEPKHIYSDSDKIRNGIKWFFNMDNSYGHLSTTILNFAVPFHTETEWSVLLFEQLYRVMMLLLYFRRRSSVIPWSVDVNHGTCIYDQGCARVVSLRRVRVLDNLVNGLQNALLRDRVQVMLLEPRLRLHAGICHWVLRRFMTSQTAFGEIHKWTEIGAQYYIDGHTDELVRRVICAFIQLEFTIIQQALDILGNPRPPGNSISIPDIRNLRVPTDRLTLPFPHDNHLLAFDSSPFLVRGLRFCLRVYPNRIGDGRMSYMSVFLVLANTQLPTCNDSRFPLAIRVTTIANRRRYANMTYTITVRNLSIGLPSHPQYDIVFGLELFASHQLMLQYFVRDGMITFIIELEE